MHSYRWGNFKEAVKAGADNASWYEMLGLQSTGHGPQQPIAITFTDKENPIVTGLADWTTVNEELYNNVQILTAKPLAKGTQKIPEKKDKKGKVTPASEATAVVAWTNEFGPKKTRIFSTTIGHNNATVEDARYLDLVARGLLWSVGKLEADGKASAGFGK
jgi:type 1 glutamine amidotransferase